MKWQREKRNSQGGDAGFAREEEGAQEADWWSGGGEQGKAVSAPKDETPFEVAPGEGEEDYDYDYDAWWDDYDYNAEDYDEEADDVARRRLQEADDDDGPMVVLPDSSGAPP